MTTRTPLTAALCAVALIVGCNSPEDVGQPETSGLDGDVPGGLASFPPNAAFDPNRRHFALHGVAPVAPTAIHAEHVEFFLRQPGAGFGRMVVIDWPVRSDWTELVSVSPSDRSLGGDRGGNGEVSYNPVTETLTLSDGTHRERRERVWLLTDQQLVSLSTAAGPSVYLKSPQKQQELMKKKPDGASTPKRPLDEFETEALAKLRAGDEVALRSDDRRMRMLGAIRARKDCLSCHDQAKEGDLLGAFTYTLKLQSEETPPAHRLTDTAGLTDRQVWAVKSIEAVGGKLIRTAGGPVTEVQLSFARKAEAATFQAQPWNHSFSTRLQARDSALPHLLEFPELTALDVSDSLVSDAGLKTIAALKNLAKLDLRDTSTTEAGVAELKKALPKCEVLTSPLAPPPAP